MLLRGLRRRASFTTCALDAWNRITGRLDPLHTPSNWQRASLRECAGGNGFLEDVLDAERPVILIRRVQVDKVDVPDVLQVVWRHGDERGDVVLVIHSNQGLQVLQREVRVGDGVERPTQLRQTESALQVGVVIIRVGRAPGDQREHNHRVLHRFLHGRLALVVHVDVQPDGVAAVREVVLQLCGQGNSAIAPLGVRDHEVPRAWCVERVLALFQLGGRGAMANPLSDAYNHRAQTSAKDDGDCSRCKASSDRVNLRCLP